METYNNFISQFEILDNPPKKEGFHRHHIVPECEQEKLHGQVVDNRQVYVTPAKHLWLHILYDKENGTNTSQFLVSITKKSKEYFDCFEKCLAYSYTFSKQHQRNRELNSGKNNGMYGTHRSGEDNPFYGQTHSEAQKAKWSKERRGRKLPEEWKSNMSKSHMGNQATKGMHWFTNGEENKVAFECPEGWWSGRTFKDKDI